MSPSNPEIERRLQTLEGAGGFSHYAAEIEAGTRETPDGMQDPPNSSSRAYAPHKTGSVRGEPGTPSGRDVGRENDEKWLRDNPNYGVPFPEHLRSKISKNNKPATIKASVQKARYDLTTCLNAQTVEFIPRTRVEISDITLFSGKSSGIALRGLFRAINSNSQSDSPERNVQKTALAEGAVKGVIERLAQGLGDDRRDYRALKALLRHQSSGEEIPEELSDTARRAYVRYLDLSDLKAGQNLTELSFDPLVARTIIISGQKQIVDTYHYPKKAAQVDAYIQRRIAEGIQIGTILGALTDTLARGHYCRDRLMEANAYPWIKSIGQGVFDVLDVHKPN